MRVRVEIGGERCVIGDLVDYILDTVSVSQVYQIVDPDLFVVTDRRRVHLGIIVSKILQMV